MTTPQAPNNSNQRPPQFDLLWAIAAAVGTALWCLCQPTLESLSSCASAITSLLDKIQPTTRIAQAVVGMVLVFTIVSSLIMFQTEVHRSEPLPQPTSTTRSEMPTERTAVLPPLPPAHVASNNSLGGTIATNPTPTNNTVIHIVGQVAAKLKYRDDPSTTAKELGEFEPETTVSIISKDRHGQWLWVAAKDGRRGWVFAAFVQINGRIEDIPIDPMTEQPFATGVVIAEPFLYVHDQPARDAKVVDEYRLGTAVIILGRNKDGSWLRVAAVRKYSGWVAAEWITFTADLETIPVENAMTTAYPRGITIDEPINLRMGPSNESMRIRQLRRDTHVLILSKDAQSAWVRVVAAGNYVGWISTDYIHVDRAWEDIPTE